MAGVPVNIIDMFEADCKRAEAERAFLPHLEKLILGWGEFEDRIFVVDVTEWAATGTIDAQRFNTLNTASQKIGIQAGYLDFFGDTIKVARYRKRDGRLYVFVTSANIR